MGAKATKLGSCDKHPAYCQAGMSSAGLDELRASEPCKS